MQINRFNDYIESMNRMEAQEMLAQMKVIDYPNMKSESRNKLHRQLFDKANPEARKERAISPEQMAGLLNGSF